jgi:hypothetical protein
MRSCMLGACLVVVLVSIYPERSSESAYDTFHEVSGRLYMRGLAHVKPHLLGQVHFRDLAFWLFLQVHLPATFVLGVLGKARIVIVINGGKHRRIGHLVGQKSIAAIRHRKKRPSCVCCNLFRHRHDLHLPKIEGVIAVPATRPVLDNTNGHVVLPLRPCCTHLQASIWTGHRLTAILIYSYALWYHHTRLLGSFCCVSETDGDACTCNMPHNSQTRSTD